MRHAGVCRRRVAPAAVLAAAACLLAACGGGGGSPAAGATASGAPAESPRSGGTLTFAEYSPPRGLDPIYFGLTGSLGLIETTAVFDTLMRYDAGTGTYEPGTAESVTPNADSTQWTIKLHPGVTFTDGTPYNADAVAFNLNRARSGTAGGPPCATVWGCPANQLTGYPASFIASAVAVDAMTVHVTLTRPWGAFPAALAAELGLVGSPTAIKKCDPAAPVSQCAFNTAPVGAGPFVVTSYKAGEVIVMTRNPNYWGGQVYLDGLRFVTLGDGGGLRSLDAVKTGQVQAAYLRDPAAVSQAHADHMPGVFGPQFSASILLMNMKSGPTTDVRLRKAVAQAVDVDVVNQRAWDGKAPAGNAYLPTGFRYSPGVAGPSVDQAAAKKLVDEVKASGWDGRLRLVTTNATAATNIGLAIQAMLENVGIQVTLDNDQDPTATAGMVTKLDYQLIVNGLGLYNDDTAAYSLAGYYASTSPLDRTGVNDPKLDAALNAVVAAGSDTEKKAAYRDVVTTLDSIRPDLPLATFEEFVVTTPKVHGIVMGEEHAVRLDKAWIG